MYVSKYTFRPMDPSWVMLCVYVDEPYWEKDTLLDASQKHLISYIYFPMVKVHGTFRPQKVG